jgi:hypothetical protein
MEEVRKEQKEKGAEIEEAELRFEKMGWRVSFEKMGWRVSFWI